MQARTLVILLATLCLGAALGIVWLGQDSMAVELPPAADGWQDSDYRRASEADDVPGPQTGAFDPGDTVRPMTVASEARDDQPQGLEAGIIRGDVQLAVSVLDRLGAMTVIVEEVRSAFAHDGKFAAPHRIICPVDRGRGTPTFEVRDVPFSQYPYRVSLHVEGLNGGQRMLSVTEQEPVHDIVLAITPGVPFSILLRDQDGTPHTDIDLLLRPVGLPNGRPRLTGKTDNFGSAVFEDVLAGNYEIVPTSGGQPFGDAETVSVQPGNRHYAGRVQGQGHVMTIARGVQVDVEIHDAFGYGIGGCKVTATASDRRLLTELEGTTDDLGRLRFPHLKPGAWHFTVERQGFHRVDRQLHLQADQPPMQQRIRLVRSRRD